MRKFLELTNELFPKNFAVFFSGDVGVSSLQKEILKEKQSAFGGVYLRCTADNQIYSGIILAKNKKELRQMMFALPQTLQEAEVELLNIQKIPLTRIPSYPLFSIISDNPVEDRIDISTEYWKKFDDDIEALKNWYLDLLKYRRELVYFDFPQIATSVPSWLCNHNVFVIYNEKSHIIVTKYYRTNASKDTVCVEKTDETIRPDSKTFSKIFSKIFSLPSEENAISEGFVLDIEHEKIYANWEHPFFTAAEELKKEINKFNSVQNAPTLDAYFASKATITNWTYQEINKRRELVKRYPFLKSMFEPWIKPIQVIVRYVSDDGNLKKISGGFISAMFVNGPEDRIIVEKVKNREEMKMNESLFKDYFPKTSSVKPFFKFSSILRFYLGDKI